MHIETATETATETGAGSTASGSRGSQDWSAIARELARGYASTVNAREEARQSPDAELDRFRASGLVNLLIPTTSGGLGGSFLDAARVVLEISKADASIGLVVGLHYMMSSVPRFFDYGSQAAAIDRVSARHRWLWSNVTSAWGRFPAQADADGGFTLSGELKWNTGLPLADVLLVSAQRDEREELLWSFIPPTREGIHYRNDWNHLGVRLSETGSVVFDRVKVLPGEIVPSTLGSPQTSFPPFFGVVSSLFLAGVSLGAALGAIDAALAFVRGKRRPLPGAARVDSVARNPLTQATIGDFWVRSRAALALLERNAEEAQSAWARRASLGQDEIASLTRDLGLPFRVFANQVALDIATRLFDVTGAVGTARHLGFDRYWRDIRTISLHEPLNEVQRRIGESLLEQVPLDYLPSRVNLWRNAQTD